MARDYDLRVLASKKTHTKAEKAWLVAEGEKHGVEAPTNENCPDCWRDMAIRIAAAMAPKCGPRFKNGYGYIHGGRLYTQADLEGPGAMERMEAAGFPMQLVVKDAEN